MDIDTSAFQASLLGSSHAFTAPKVTNAQLSGGLMRYHSAPSSVLVGLLDDDFFPASEDSEFAQLLSDGMGSFSSLLDQKVSQQDDTGFPLVAKEEKVSYLPHGRVHDQHPRFIGGGNSYHEPLSAISEYGVEETVENYCGNQGPLSADQAPHQLAQIDGAALKTGLVPNPQVNSFNTGLIRQSSSPSDILTRLAMEENSEKLKLGCGMAGQHHPGAEVGQRKLPASQMAAHSTVTDVKCSSPVSTVSSPVKSNALLRQSSSPAGLLSQVNIEDFSIVHEKGPLVSNSGIFPSGVLPDRRGPAPGRSLAMSGWDDNMAELAMQHFAALGQRKRGRVLEDKLMCGLQGSPADLGTVTMSNYSPPSSSTQVSIDSLEGSLEDSVLCKARAKRGCATHPRSIAERQRRIKISERMKKLQDLVPNLDKQANTAEMLDEVVEYVKLLQRQVQELSINRPLCNGSCQQAGKSP